MKIIEEIGESINLTKVLYSYDITKADEDYLEYISLDKNVTWNDYTIYFTILKEDFFAISENQRVEQIRLKRLSGDYKESLAILVQDIAKDINISRIRKIIKG